jgi:N-dimethylarginine dimethylaminohydrolase
LRSSHNAPLEGGEVIYFPNAFDSYSINEIERRIPPKKRILVSEEDACQFSCNLFNVNRLIFTNAMSLTLQKDLEARGYQIKLCPVSEFMKAGGGVKCLTMKLEQDSIVRAPQKENLSSPIRNETLKFSGHLLE